MPEIAASDTRRTALAGAAAGALARPYIARAAKLSIAVIPKSPRPIRFFYYAHYGADHACEGTPGRGR